MIEHPEGEGHQFHRTCHLGVKVDCNCTRTSSPILVELLLRHHVFPPRPRAHQSEEAVIKHLQPHSIFQQDSKSSGCIPQQKHANAKLVDCSNSQTIDSCDSCDRYCNGALPQAKYHCTVFFQSHDQRKKFFFHCRIIHLARIQFLAIIRNRPTVLHNASSELFIRSICVDVKRPSMIGKAIIASLATTAFNSRKARS